MHHPTRNFFALLVGLWLAIASVAADYKAPDKYTLREWTESNGLPDNEVASVQLDEKGFLWVVTSSGPVRFDGSSFEPIKMPSAASPRSAIYYRGKSANGCSGFLAPVNIPAGTDSTTVPETDGFYGQGPDGVFQFIQEPSLSGKTVRTLFADSGDSLWLACDDGTLLRRQGRQIQVFPPPEVSSGKKLPIFATDKDRHLWISIGSYVARFDGTQWIAQPIEPADAQIRIYSSRTGGPWLFTRNAVFTHDGHGWQEIIKLPELLGAHYIQTALEDRHGNLWIGTRSQGLFRLTEKQLLHVPSSSEDIVSLCEDGDDNIWVATHGGGLNRLRPKAHQLYDQTSGLKDIYSYTVTEDASGVIWLANRDGGVARIINGTVDPISRRANWRPFSAMSVAPAIGGGIWISTGIGGYRSTEENPEQVQRIATLAKYKGVRSSLVTRNGDYWFSVDPDRIARLRDDQVTIFGPSDGLDGREIRAITEDATGAIWLGAAEGRIYRSTSDGRFERVPFLGMENAGAVQVLRFESDGTLLAGTTRYGLFIFPPGDRATPKVLNSKNGLPNNNITQILIDEFDRYWFASRGGIFWIHRPQVQAFFEGKSSRIHAVTLGTDDGLPGLVCLGLFQPAAWKGRDGKLWFATRRGVLCTDPALISGIDDLPPVTVSEVKCDGRTSPISEKLEIQSTTRKTELRLSVLCLSTPERVLVRYQLDGFDNDWIVLKNSRTATYPRLPPGKYVFRAMASNGNDVWNEQAELLTLIVIPPWWQSIWAQLLYLTTLVIIVGMTVRIWSHRRLKLRLQKLEQEQAVERERTRIARNIHDELGASLTHISLITQAAQHENPTQASTFEKIYEATHEITRSMDEVVWAVNPQCDDLENLIYYVSNFAQRLLSAAGIRCRLDLPQTLPALRLSSPVRHNLFLCCKEALNNVVKHSRADLVTIAIIMNDSTLQLMVADNGRGLSQPATPVTSHALRIAAGRGLDNLRNRMAEVGGTCEFSDQPEGGLIVTFSIDLSASTP